LKTWAPEVRALAGVIVTISREGDAEVIRGLVRAGDRKALAALQVAVGSSAQQSAESRSEAAASAPAANEREAGGLSESLARRLAAHRTVALQLLLCRNSTVALAALAHVFLHRIFNDEYRRPGMALMIAPQVSVGALEAAADDLKSAPAWQAIDAAKQAWKARLPEPSSAWLGWLIELPQSELLEILALCAALTVNALPNSGAAADANALAQAVGLDMADWWEPTAQGYLSHVSKAQIIEALSGAGSGPAEPGLAALKKDALVATAATRLAGKRWLPVPLRRVAG
jgi:ParB family chromosome partitioning protein